MKDHSIIGYANDSFGVIANCRDIKKCIASIIVIIAGIVVFAIPFVLNIESQWIEMLCIVSGPTGIVAGIFISLFFCGTPRYTPTDSEVFVHNNYISHNNLANVRKCLNEANICTGSINFDKKADMRIDTLESADGEFCVCMVFGYVDFSYAPLCGPYIVTRSMLKRLQCM